LILFFLKTVVSADQFRYTSEGNAITIRGVNDSQQFAETREALALLGLFLFYLFFFSFIRKSFCFEKELKIKFKFQFFVYYPVFFIWVM